MAPRKRIELLDAMRGAALFGVLLVNLRYFSLFEFLTKGARAALPTAGWDYWIGLALTALVDTKAITVFSLLFGLSFIMQAQRAETRRGSWEILETTALGGCAIGRRINDLRNTA